MSKRQDEEEKVLTQLQSGSGLIGTTKIDLRDRKIDICKIMNKKDLP